VALAKRVKQAGYKLRFRAADVVRTRMYRSFAQMWEGWTKNLALLFPHPRRLAFRSLLEFAVIVACIAVAIWSAAIGEIKHAVIAAALAVAFLAFLLNRVRRAHFEWMSNSLAIFGLPLFAVLLLNSTRSHKRGLVRWKGREYGAAVSAPSGPVSSESDGHTASL
jgi:hypothetical protein